MDSISNPGAGVRDRISELPDPLISQILSFLDTKEAVRTSVLSTRWKKQWTHVPILDISIFGKVFPVAIDRVLFFRDSSDIQVLRLFLVVEDLDFTRVDNWICTAICRNVVELDLGVVPDLGNMELPQSLFTCKTLKFMKLRSPFIVNPPTTGCFPSLKVLDVQVDDHDNSLLEKLFSICPVLEDLTIEGEVDQCQACDINISAPKLKMLKIYLHVNGYDIQEEPNLDVYNVYINASELVNFDVCINDSSAILFQVNANSHFKANINPIIRHKQSSPRLAILDAISTVKHLSLSSRCVFEVLPNFDNLTHLKLGAPFHMNCWAFLIEFLKKSPNLEHLVITQPFICSLDWPRHGEFNPPEFVPVCMLSHLKTITIENFEGRRDEMGVAKYLLKYGEVLNKMSVKITSKRLSKMEAIRKEVLMFEVGSKTCHVEIIN